MVTTRGFKRAFKKGIESTGKSAGSVLGTVATKVGKASLLSSREIFRGVKEWVAKNESLPFGNDWEIYHKANTNKFNKGIGVDWQPYTRQKDYKNDVAFSIPRALLSDNTVNNFEDFLKKIDLGEFTEEKPGLFKRLGREYNELEKLKNLHNQLLKLGGGIEIIEAKNSYKKELIIKIPLSDNREEFEDRVRATFRSLGINDENSIKETVKRLWKASEISFQQDQDITQNSSEQNLTPTDIAATQDDIHQELVKSVQEAVNPQITENENLQEVPQNPGLPNIAGVQDKIIRQEVVQSADGANVQPLPQAATETMQKIPNPQINLPEEKWKLGRLNKTEYASLINLREGLKELNNSLSCAGFESSPDAKELEAGINTFISEAEKLRHGGTEPNQHSQKPAQEKLLATNYVQKLNNLKSFCADQIKNCALLPKQRLNMEETIKRIDSVTKCASEITHFINMFDIPASGLQSKGAQYQWKTKDDEIRLIRHDSSNAFKEAATNLQSSGVKQNCNMENQLPNGIGLTNRQKPIIVK